MQPIIITTRYRHYNVYAQLLELNIECAYANLKMTILLR